MKKVCGILALCALALSSPAAVVQFAFTNWNSTTLTGTISVFQINGPNAYGNWLIMGLPERFSTTNGIITTNLLKGNYEMRFLSIGVSNVLFAVPDDTSTNVYYVTQPENGGIIISGAHTYNYSPGVQRLTSQDSSVTITPGNGMGVVDLHAGAGGGLNSIQGTNMVLRTNGVTITYNAVLDTNAMAQVLIGQSNNVVGAFTGDGRNLTNFTSTNMVGQIVPAQVAGTLSNNISGSSTYVTTGILTNGAAFLSLTNVTVVDGIGGNDSLAVRNVPTLAFKTFKAAAQASLAGDTMYVLPGFYDTGTSFTFRPTNMTVIAYGATIQGNVLGGTGFLVPEGTFYGFGGGYSNRANTGIGLRIDRLTNYAKFDHVFTFGGTDNFNNTPQENLLIDYEGGELGTWWDNITTTATGKTNVVFRFRGVTFRTYFNSAVSVTGKPFNVSDGCTIFANGCHVVIDNGETTSSSGINVLSGTATLHLGSTTFNLNTNQCPKLTVAAGGTANIYGHFINDADISNAGTVNWQGWPNNAPATGMLLGYGGNVVMWTNPPISSLAPISANSVVGNNTGGSAVPLALSASQVLDLIGNTRGSILERGAAGWTIIPPGTSGWVLTSAGGGADPAYQPSAGGGGSGFVSQNPLTNGISGTNAYHELVIPGYNSIFSVSNNSVSMLFTDGVGLSFIDRGVGGSYLQLIGATNTSYLSNLVVNGWESVLGLRSNFNSGYFYPNGSTPSVQTVMDGNSNGVVFIGVRQPAGYGDGSGIQIKIGSNEWTAGTNGNVTQSGNLTFNGGGQGIISAIPGNSLNIGSGNPVPSYGLTLNNSLTNNNGTQDQLQVAPVINQSGTAGYNGININITENSTGSGPKNEIVAKSSTSSTNDFIVDRVGNVVATSFQGDGGGLVNLNAGALTGYVYTVNVDASALWPGDTLPATWTTNTPGTASTAFQSAGLTFKGWQSSTAATNNYLYQGIIPQYYGGGAVTAAVYVVSATNSSTKVTNVWSGAGATLGTALGTAVTTTNNLPITTGSCRTNFTIGGITLAGNPAPGAPFIFQVQSWGGSAPWSSTNNEWLLQVALTFPVTNAMYRTVNVP